VWSIWLWLVVAVAALLAAAVLVVCLQDFQV
jgi:hypothetical protein